MEAVQAKNEEKNDRTESKKSSGSFFARLGNSFKNLKGKKRIEIFVAVGLIAVILIIYLSTFDLFSSGSNGGGSKNELNTSSDYRREMEEKLNTLLSDIKGAGKVDAIINFESGTEIIIAYIESHSKNGSTDSSGKYTENTTETKNPQIINVDGNQIPLILKEVYPKVKAVLISCQGASNTKIKVEIITSVSILFGIPANNIYVTQKK